MIGTTISHYRILRSSVAVAWVWCTKAYLVQACAEPSPAA
jgi:hypothetical protein